MKLADGVFVMDSFGPAGDGIWQTTGNCDFEFPGYNIDTPNSAFVYTRFGVAFLDGTYTVRCCVRLKI